MKRAGPAQESAYLAAMARLCASRGVKQLAESYKMGAADVTSAQNSAR